MASAAQFASIFLAACAANSFVSWLALQNQWGGNLAKFFYCSITLFILFSLVFDDGLKAILKTESFTYYTIIGIVFFSALIGGTLIWISH
jgi:hypothetical protein